MVIVHPAVEPWTWWLLAFAMYATGRFVLAYARDHVRRRRHGP